jgi:hypothetical protein
MPVKPHTPLPPLSRGFRSMMPKDLKELLRAFNDHEVKYLVVGGYAFGVHAEPRATKDLDLFIGSDKENSEAVFHALAQYGAPLDSLSPADFRDGTVFQIGQPPGRIDLLQHIDGVSFEEAWENRMEGLWDGEIRTAVIPKMISFETSSQAEVSSTFLTLRSSEPGGSKAPSIAEIERETACRGM